MSNHTHRHAEAPSPPPPPPLPPQRQGFVANALARVVQPFGYGSRPTSATGHRPTNPRPSKLSGQRSSRWAPKPLLRSFSILPKVPEVPQGSNETQTDVERSPTSSKSTSHKTGIPIAALDISPDHSHAVLAGHNILKTIQVSEAACTEDVNLRASIIAYAATHEASGTAIAPTHKDQWAANDVKWSHGQYNTTIATAAASGQIVVYDINRTGLEIARLHEHSRQVHRLGFNPYYGHLMLSGSQDGTVRLWDLRALSGERSVTTCQSRQRFSGNSEGVRDLRWSPRNGVEFALGTDNGVIQRWDFRNEKTPLLRVSAHEHKTCYSIDWHPDGKHLVSGGADKNIKVWDFSSSDRRKKQVWEIRAPQAVHNVRWRPACWSSGKHSPAEWQSTQIATSYDQEDPRIHIWDFRRPFLPFRTFDRYETPASALLWHSENLLWSVGSAGMFTQTDINFVPKTMDHLSPNLLTVAADGQILFFSQKRERKRQSIEDVLDELSHKNARQNIHAPKTVRGTSGNTQSSYEDRGLLGSSLQHHHRKSTGSTRTVRSSTGTPPSSTSTGQVQDLEESLHTNRMYRSSQVAGIGYIEGVFDAPTFKYLAKNYGKPQIATNDTTECNLHLILSDVLRRNADLAEHTSQYRLAQSLRMMALAVETELGARAEMNYEARMQAAILETDLERVSLRAEDLDNLAETHSTKESILEYDQPQLKDSASTTSKTTSNMTTPLAKPVSDDTIAPTVPSTADSLHLPNPKWSKQPVKTVAGISELAKMTSPKSPSKENSRPQDRHENTIITSEAESSPQQTSLERRRKDDLADMDRQMAERRAAMDNYRAVPRSLLRLDDPNHQPDARGSHVPIIDRRDSNESFQLFPTSSDSPHRGHSVIGSLESTEDSQQDTSSPEMANLPEHAKDSIDEGHADQALTFDDEAELSSPPSQMVASPEVPQASQETTDGDIEEPRTPTALYRPDVFQQPIVLYNEMEPMFRRGAESGEDSAEDKVSAGTPKYLLSDYILSEQKPDNLHPWAASNMFTELIDYHTEKLCDAQLPTWLLLHLGRWVYHSITHERAVTIFLQYHQRCVDLDLFIPACELRNLVGPEFPEIRALGEYGITPGGPWCTDCNAPNKGNKRGICLRCNKRWGECPFCQGRGPMQLDGDSKVCVPATGDLGAGGLWTWCQNCGHGGHVACMNIFWDNDDGEGQCPTIGCMCDCMPGKHRDAIWAKMEKEREKNKPGVVSKDEWKVPESAAAQRARGLMGLAPQGLGIGIGGGGGRGGTSLAAAGRSSSGGKRVRIVVPEERGEEGGDAGKEKGKGKGVEKDASSGS